MHLQTEQIASTLGLLPTQNNGLNAKSYETSDYIILKDDFMRMEDIDKR
jgi:hypothetical protein